MSEFKTTIAKTLRVLKSSTDVYNCTTSVLTDFDTS